MVVRLIDADVFFYHMAEMYIRQGWQSEEIHFSLRDILMNLDNEKTAVKGKIVHCRDCEYFRKRTGMCDYWSKFGTVYTEPNGYCNNAKKVNT